MNRVINFFNIPIVILCILFTMSSCAKKKQNSLIEEQKQPYCSYLNPPYKIITQSTGSATVFDINPKNAFNDPNLLPTSSKIDSSVSELMMNVQLQNLKGYGTLSGTFIEVTSGVCPGVSVGGFGAFSESNTFQYSHRDYRFSEVMSYYYGDQYRSGLNEANVLLPIEPVVIISNCPYEDNAFYVRDRKEDGSFLDIVCLGSASRFSSNHTTFADDSHVITHELQHAQTTYAYSPSLPLGRLTYDEAGAINEGISDAIALIYSLPRIKNNFDIKKFSFWALESLFGTAGDYSRGVRRCPTYDSTYPNCLNFKNNTAGFSVENNTVSFSYPDGLGYPYTGFYQGMKKAFLENTSHQEIHQTSIISSGIIYEIFEVLKKSRGYDEGKSLTSKILSRALQYLPKPNSMISITPVNHLNLFSELLSASVAYGLKSSEIDEIKQIGIDRGVYQYPTLKKDWARFVGFKFSEQNGSARYDGEFNSGDIGYLYLNFENRDPVTAAGVLVDFKILDDNSPLILLDARTNDGSISNKEAMVQYSKINGTNITNVLTINPSFSLPVSNDYFGTFTTEKNMKSIQSAAFAVVVKPGSSPGIVHASARLQPTNGPEEIIPFTFEIKP